MIGALNQRITFQSYTRSADGAGGKTKTWADLASVPNVWAMVKPKGAKESTEEGRVNASGVYIFTVRNRTDLDERMRIVWGGSNYNIRAIHREGWQSQYLQIEAERGV